MHPPIYELIASPSPIYTTSPPHSLSQPQLKSLVSIQCMNHAVCYVNLSINCIVFYCFKCRLLRVLLSVDGGVPFKCVCLCVWPQLMCSNACGWVTKTYGRGTHVQAAHACNASCCGQQSRSSIAYCRKNESHKV